MTKKIEDGGHTELPWDVGPYGGIYRLNSDGIHGPLIVSGLTKSGWLPNRTANEAFIVKAVNAYDNHMAEIAELRSALKPFAFAKSQLNFDRFDEGNTAWVAVDGAGSDKIFFFVGDVIRAREALARSKP